MENKGTDSLLPLLTDLCGELALGKHADTEAFGLAFGGIEFGVGSFHNSGLAIPGG